MIKSMSPLSGCHLDFGRFYTHFYLPAHERGLLDLISIYLPGALTERIAFHVFELDGLFLSFGGEELHLLVEFWYFLCLIPLRINLQDAVDATEVCISGAWPRLNYYVWASWGWWARRMVGIELEARNCYLSDWVLVGDFDWLLGAP